MAVKHDIVLVVWVAACAGSNLNVSLLFLVNRTWRASSFCYAWKAASLQGRAQRLPI